MSSDTFLVSLKESSLRSWADGSPSTFARNISCAQYKMDDLKIAIVHDDFIQHGGAERLVLAMLKIWPQADLYSVTASDTWRREIKKLSNKKIITTWVAKLSFKEKLFRQYYLLYPLSVESFNFDGYDLVVSSSARYAHGIITKPGTAHIAYVNSPARFIWQEDLAPKGFLTGKIVSWHRAWDKVASMRPDYIIANSKTPAKRIEEYWGRRPDKIIYPFIDYARFSAGALGGAVTNKFPVGEYFLIVTRLSKWKRVDIAIEACNELKLPLVIVGRGDHAGYLQSISGSTVTFLDSVNDAEVSSLYYGCKALIMTQEEDFGLTALEAQACGKPVIAFRSGGALETVVEGVTGVFFDSQNEESLKTTLQQFDPKVFLGENCTAQSSKFDFNKFRSELENFCENVLRNR